MRRRRRAAPKSERLGQPGRLLRARRTWVVAARRGGGPGGGQLAPWAPSSTWVVAALRGGAGDAYRPVHAVPPPRSVRPPARAAQAHARAVLSSELPAEAAGPGRGPGAPGAVPSIFPNAEKGFLENSLSTRSLGAPPARRAPLFTPICRWRHLGAHQQGARAHAGAGSARGRERARGGVQQEGGRGARVCASSRAPPPASRAGRGRGRACAGCAQRTSLARARGARRGARRDWGAVSARELPQQGKGPRARAALPAGAGRAARRPRRRWSWPAPRSACPRSGPRRAGRRARCGPLAQPRSCRGASWARLPRRRPFGAARRGTAAPATSVPPGAACRVAAHWRRPPRALDCARDPSAGPPTSARPPRRPRDRTICL